jgi:hypothetical protein
MKKKLLVFLCAALLVFGLTAGAGAIPLSELFFDGAEIQWGDKRFFDWELLYEEATPGTSWPDYNQVQVSPIGDPKDPLGSDLGLRFDAGGQLTVPEALFGIEFLDVSFSFWVATTDPLYFVKGASLSIPESGFYTGSDGLVTIEENLFDSGLNPLVPGVPPHMKVEADAWFGNSLDDFIDFAGQRLIKVEKNILISNFSEDDVASLSVFEQRFSQAAVPEPSTVLLLGMGLVGLAGLRRKLKK